MTRVLPSLISNLQSVEFWYSIDGLATRASDGGDSIAGGECAGEEEEADDERVGGGWDPQGGGRRRRVTC